MENNAIGHFPFILFRKFFWQSFSRSFISPAEIVTVREDPGPGHPVQDGEGDGDSQQEVGECQAEDEDVPGGPHLLGLESGHHDQAVPDNLMKTLIIHYISV